MDFSKRAGSGMFIGHWAPALAAAAATPRAPKLGTLFIAAQLVDWAFFALLLTGTEHMRVSPGISAMNPMDLYHMPYTHSLLGSACWAVGFGLLVYALLRDRLAAIIAGLVVLSHWLLDLLVHVPDLTIAGTPPKLGFGLWNHPAIEMPLEIVITFGALAWFARRTRGPALPLVALGLLMAALQAVDWFGPRPTEVSASMSYLAFAGYGAATLVAWWVGRTRQFAETRD